MKKNGGHCGMREEEGGKRRGEEGEWVGEGQVLGVAPLTPKDLSPGPSYTTLRLNITKCPIDEGRGHVKGLAVPPRNPRHTEPYDVVV
ncbi:hypothetical protein Pcinc_020602 [Petrolisthes cinctipes]|uniref:Uncharacterized protein n=1 Tax=Petrolisthes cinctipes TaxID=88211 RepID=A0AAE1FHR8_PETCI|nr:hypothetical protein Pcinc_020602 [Petrolisthes cinctipes]